VKAKGKEGSRRTGSVKGKVKFERASESKGESVLLFPKNCGSVKTKGNQFFI